ncbi:MAG: helix-turn-helix domain-containing protein [Burkholderiaceae bacterium]|nr:helix-turn-helix domain-containing protein [Burkholderiaceae bacterium]
MSPVQLAESQLRVISETLKSAREKRGDNLAEAAFRIALSPAQLRAIESGDLRPFYNPGYFMQAANRYAAFLGVDLPEIPAAPTPDPQPVQVSTTPDSVVVLAQPPASTTASAVDNNTAVPAPTIETTAGEPAEMQPSAGAKSGGVRWGWIAFAAVCLITLGILRISVDPAAKRESAVTATTTVTAPAQPIQEEMKPAEVKPTAEPTKAAVAPTPPPTTIKTNDGQLTLQTSTWVQVVKNSGEKINLKAEPGQKVEFAANETAAVVFGQPEKASLSIRGKPVNLGPFITQDSPPRALVILNQIKE